MKQNHPESAFPLSKEITPAVPADLNNFLHVKDKRTTATVVAAAMTAIYHGREHTPVCNVAVWILQVTHAQPL